MRVTPWYVVLWRGMSELPSNRRGQYRPSHSRSILAPDELGVHIRRLLLIRNASSVVGRREREGKRVDSRRRLKSCRDDLNLPGERVLGGREPTHTHEPTCCQSGISSSRVRVGRQLTLRAFPLNFWLHSSPSGPSVSAGAVLGPTTSPPPTADAAAPAVVVEAFDPRISARHQPPTAPARC